LTWALEIGDVQRFSSIKKAISYCGLCGAEKSSGNVVQRTPLSKQRNQHLQTTLIEAAKMAPQQSGAGHALRQGKAEGQCESRNAGGGKEAGGLPDGGRSWAA